MRAALEFAACCQWLGENGADEAGRILVFLESIGIPFATGEGFDPATFEDPLALTLVDLTTGRAKPRAILDAMAGSQLYRRGDMKVEAQAGVLNLFDKTYLLNFLSIFNGTHYGAPRIWTARLKVSF